MQIMSKEESLVFRIQPRLLRHLGEQLIRDSSLAVFELVKNAYDADATACQVTLETAEAPRRMGGEAKLLRRSKL